MKSGKFIPLCFLVLFSLPGLFDGCTKIEDGLSTISWRINFNLVTTTWDVQFIDAATGLPIGANSDDRIAVTITGSDQNNILDLAGIRQPTFYSTKGALALALHPDRLSPQEVTPVRFYLHASHPSYLPVHVPVLSYRDGINPIKVYMVSRTQAPANIDLLTQTNAGIAVDGKLVDTLRISTPANMASLQMSAGAEILDASGAQLVGNLTVAFSYWEGGTTNGLKALPGGQVSVNSTGKPGLVYLACGIYVDILDRDNRSASQISKPADCTVVINPSVYNPTTKEVLTAGEAVPVWFMNPRSGIWEARGATILQASGNKLKTVFPMQTTGMFMIGWINENLCTSPLILHPATLPEYQTVPYALTLNIFEVFQDELRFVRTAGINGQATRDFDLRFLPDNPELVFRFEGYTGEDEPYYKNPDPILLSGFCGSVNPFDFDLLPRPNSTYKKIEVVFIDIQHNNTRYYPKVFPGYYRKTDATTWQSAFVYQGQAYMVNPKVGELYQMGINFKGKFHLKEVTVGTQDMVLVEIPID